MHTLTISSGKLSASFITLGACLVDLRLVGYDRSLVLGFPSREDYAATDHYSGAVIGRYANRIRDGRAVIDGKPVQLSRNGGGHHLHGGETGLARQQWSIVEHERERLVLAARSADGHEGYPGNVAVTVTYEVAESATLRTHFAATTDAPTLINLCQHPYFNFTGRPTIDDHVLEIDASHYLPSSAELIPTGEIARVAGTPYDFLVPRAIGTNRPDPGFNNTYCLAPATRNEPRFAARLSAPRGPVMELWTTQPGLHLYDGYKLHHGLVGADGRRYGPGSGLCLEAQGWPDSPNHQSFPSTALRPNEKYAQLTEYRFAAGV
jgi:aldose 1-epimerase